MWDTHAGDLECGRLPRICMWELPCTLPGLIAGSSLACFSSSTLDSQCTAPASPLLQAGSGEVSLERKDGMALAQGLGEVREGPSHPSFLPFENWFCPLKPFRTNSDTASCNHTCGQQVEEEGGLQHSSALLKVHPEPAWSSDTTAFPIVRLHPSTKNHCRVQAHPPPPQHFH